MQAPEKAFNDFFLLGLSHLLAEEIMDWHGERLVIKREARKEIEKRKQYGKAVIRQQTKEGDLIAFESPEGATFKDFCKLYGVIEGKEKLAKNKRELFRQWNRTIMVHANFYADLANYAKSIGRRVVSLEPSARKAASRLKIAELKEPSTATQRYVRLKYLLEDRADLSFLRRIQNLQPKMVVVAKNHAIYSEGMLKPKGVDYFPKLNPVKRKLMFITGIMKHVNYLNRKTKRLARQRELAKRRAQKPKI